MTTLINTHQARKNLGELLSEAFYTDRPFVLTRGKKPMAALIGVNLFAKIFTLIEKHDPGLADTIAIMSNADVQKTLSEGEKDIKAGRVLPFDKRLLEK